MSKNKGRVGLVLAMRFYRGRRSIAPLILISAVDGSDTELSGQVHVPAGLSPSKKKLWYLLKRKLCGPQTRYKRIGEDIRN